MDGLSIGAVARLAGVSVRTLHHYDAIGLLVPSRRSPSGYRRYLRGDIERLQAVLAYRALGLDLDTIRRLLTDPAHDPDEALRRLAADLDARIARLERMRRAVHTTLEARMHDLNLTPEEMLEVFGDHDPTAHAAEVTTRWGDTDAYRQSAARTRRYAKADWARLGAESGAIEARFAAALRAGVPAEAPEAMDAAEAHRAHLTRWFYDCDPAMHVALGEMYVQDPRFTAHYDAREPGLAAYVAAAIRANAARRAPRG